MVVDTINASSSSPSLRHRSLAAVESWVFGRANYLDNIQSTFKKLIKGVAPNSSLLGGKSKVEDNQSVSVLIHNLDEAALNSSKNTSSTSTSVAPSSSSSSPQMLAPNAPRLRCLFWDISRFTARTQLILLSTGVLVFFLLCGWLEEGIIRSGALPDFQKRKYLGWFMTFVELISFAAIALGERFVRGEPVFQHKHPLHRHALVGVAMTVSRGLTNLSMQYLNYPTQVIFKSLKLLVVMVGGVVMLRKSFHWLQYVAALLFASAAMFFSLGDSSVEPNYSLIGIGIVCASLLGDAVHSNTQEWLLKNNKTANEKSSNSSGESTLLETMLYTNFFGAICSLVVVIVSGDFGDATAYCSKYSLSYPLFIGRSVVIYGGVLCLMSLFERFDAVVGTIVTTLRKVITIVASFIFFPKPMAIQYLYGLIVFIIAVCAEVRARQRPQPVPQPTAQDESVALVNSVKDKLEHIKVIRNVSDDEFSAGDITDEGQTPKMSVIEMKPFERRHTSV